MKQRAMFEAALGLINHILELPPNNPSSAHKPWQNLDPMLGEILSATKIDAVRHVCMTKLIVSLKAAASELIQSLLNSKQGGSLRGDWVRFTERDFIKLKDELLALREFFVGEADFLRFVCLRTQLKKLGEIDPEKLFKELREAGAISERTLVLLMAQPSSWRKLLKDREFSEQLVRIAGWLLDLQETRMGQIGNVRKTQQ